MKETILDVLMYLFENHMHDNCNMVISEETLLGELKEAGFNIDEIIRAFDWLERLGDISQLQEVSEKSFRIFSPDEQKRIGIDCQGFLSFIETLGILDPVSREIVIDRLLGLTPEKIDLPQVKWVTLMVLFNQRNRKEALKAMEHLVLNSSTGTAH
jgi:Smg protein